MRLWCGNDAFSLVGGSVIDHDNWEWIKDVDFFQRGRFLRNYEVEHN